MGKHSTKDSSSRSGTGDEKADFDIILFINRHRMVMTTSTPGKRYFVKAEFATPTKDTDSEL